MCTIYFFQTLTKKNLLTQSTFVDIGHLYGLDQFQKKVYSLRTNGREYPKHKASNAP